MNQAILEEEVKNDVFEEEVLKINRKFLSSSVTKITDQFVDNDTYEQSSEEKNPFHVVLLP